MPPKKPTTTKKTNPKPNPRWTPAQEKTLLDAVAKAPTNQAAFVTVAKQLGKSTGTVQQKYYNLKKASKPKRTKPTTPPKSANMATTSLRSMPTDELVTLATQVAQEIKHRQQSLNRAAKLLS